MITNDDKESLRYNAKSFKKFADLYFDKPNSNREIGIPAFVNLAFSIELYLKYLLAESEIEFKTHYLNGLFYKLNPTTQLEIINIIGINEKQFKSQLEDHSQLFVDWRYIHDVNHYRNNLFSWNDIPEHDEKKLKGYLNEKLDIDWVENAEIEKIDNKTISIYTRENNLLLKLNDKETEVNIEFDNGRIEKLFAKTDKNQTKIYEYSSTFANPEFMIKLIDSLEYIVNNHSNQGITPISTYTGYHGHSCENIR